MKDMGRVPYSKGVWVWHKLTQRSGIVIMDDGDEKITVETYRGPDDTKTADWYAASVTNKRPRDNTFIPVILGAMLLVVA